MLRSHEVCCTYQRTHKPVYPVLTFIVYSIGCALATSARSADTSEWLGLACSIWTSFSRRIRIEKMTLPGGRCEPLNAYKGAVQESLNLTRTPPNTHRRCRCVRGNSVRGNRAALLSPSSPRSGMYLALTGIHGQIARRRCWSTRCRPLSSLGGSNRKGRGA